MPPFALLQRALADVQQLGSTVHEQLALIQRLEAANKKLTSEAEIALARAEKMQQNENMVELLRQALAGLQEDRRSMQVMTVLQLTHLHIMSVVHRVNRALWSSSSPSRRNSSLLSSTDRC
jgi:hypothetical protein